MCFIDARRQAMRDNDYHFITTWRVPGTVEEVIAVLREAQDLPRWWPSVYLAVRELAPGNEHGVGKVVDLYTKGWLPYRLRWQFRVTEVNEGGFALEAWGDFVGRGVWTLVQDGPEVVVTYDWKVRADKPLLRDLSFVMKPIFSANHRWAMAMGERSLLLELARRHARSGVERALLPAPPGPTRWWPGPALLLAGAAVMVGYVLLRQRRA
jgi:hypothetical protein